MKKIITRTIFLLTFLLSNITIISAKDPEVKGVSVPTVYGIHDPIDTSLGGIEWIFILALFVFVAGLVLIANGKSLKSQIEK